MVQFRSDDVQLVNRISHGIKTNRAIRCNLPVWANSADELFLGFLHFVLINYATQEV